MSMKKKLTVVVTAVTLVALIAIGATLAWFTDSKEVTNVVTMGNIKITLEEPIFSEENENNTITGVLPNQPIDKDPTITNVGKVAGCYVLEGKILRNANIRIVRDGIIVADDKLDSLKRFKDDVKEVASGYECGMSLQKFADIKEGDIFEAYEVEEYRD